MGVHAGKAVERDGDYFGPTVNRAARVMAAGHGGQVLVTAPVAAAIYGNKILRGARSRVDDLLLRHPLYPDIEL